MAFVPEKTGTEIVDRIFQRLATYLRTFDANLFNFATLKTAQLIGTSDTRVYHGLGRPIKGRIVVALDIPVAISDGTTSPAPSSYINMRSSGPGTATVSVLFF